MLRATVPETAVNEDSDALVLKDEVGATGQRLVSPPAGDARGTQDGRQFQLSVFVASRADGGHDLRALML